MGRYLFGATLVLSACSQDVKISEELERAPIVTVLAPDDGAVFSEVDSVEFLGLVEDGNGLEDLVTLEWTSSIDGLLADLDSAAPDGAGQSSFATALTVGTHTISFSAVDTTNLSAEQAISVIVEPAATSPSVEITLPAPFSTFWPGEDIQLVGAANDPNQASNTLVAEWSHEPFDGGARELVLSTAPSPGGSVVGVWSGAEIGSHRVFLTVIDDQGNVGEAEVVIDIEDPNEGDADGDGWTVISGDCDDANPDVHPGHDEWCDLLDNDCNSLIDDKDDDSDNHVDQACTGYSGALPVDDCDDANGTVFPGAAEQADGLDNDCNGAIDDGLSVFDNDGDCFCTALTCTGSINAGCITLGVGDCDDGDPWLNPLDLDLDGTSTCQGDCDDGDPLLSGADLDGDGSSTCEGDCDDGDVALNPDDVDNDGASTCDGDCNDGSVILNIQDVDGDLWTTCDGDCNDTLASLNLDDLDGDGATTCALDCDDNDPTLNPDDVDGDGYSTCNGDCNDNDATVIPVDGDGDGTHVCNGDCDDTNPLLNPLDADGDGASSCAGDCDDGSALLNLRDLDFDGYSTCTGDCNDANNTLTPADVDGDGASSCAGDCDDGNPALSIADLDGDGSSTCAGDCDDGDPALSDLDVDGDGYSSCDGDCADTDLTVYPGQTEIPYNSKDDDCVGGDLTDVDGDGYDSTVVGGSDCNDSNAAVHPNVTEVCNNIDDDCDTIVDEENASGCSTFYYDYDNDGYGTFSQKCLCDAGDVAYFTAPNNSDCYDNNSDAHPGQTTYFYDDRGDGSWDYNCDYTQSKNDTRTATYSCNLCGFLNTDCCYNDGWLGSVPSCGQTRDWGSGCYWIPVISCDENSTAPVDIRCR